jgi:putative Holliday junction resolvase
LSRVLALDYGSARCGCAVSDPTQTLATPIDAIDRPASDEGLRQLQELVSEREVDRVVVGLPVGLSGREGPQAQEARAFAERLEALLAVPVETYDERYTTRLAQRTEGRAPEDSRAAAHLLTSYLRAREQGPRAG